MKKKYPNLGSEEVKKLATQEMKLLPNYAELRKASRKAIKSPYMLEKLKLVQEILKNYPNITKKQAAEQAKQIMVNNPEKYGHLKATKKNGTTKQRTVKQKTVEEQLDILRKLIKDNNKLLNVSNYNGLTNFGRTTAKKIYKNSKIINVPINGYDVPLFLVNNKGIEGLKKYASLVLPYLTDYPQIIQRINLELSKMNQ